MTQLHLLVPLVPLVHVMTIQRSIEFYRRFGFVIGNSFVPDGRSEPGWAWLKSGGAHLMVAQADEAFDASKDAVLFYLYCEDVPAFRAELLKDGLTVGEIQYPFYAPRGEFSVVDPDGFVLMVTHT